MPEDRRASAYLAALAEANSELEQICARLAALRIRKEQLDMVVTALQPLVESVKTQPAASAPAPVVAMPPVERRVNPDRRQSAREASADPLQRQIDQALGRAALA